MNILFYRYGSICEPDIIAGFEELGNHVSEITLEIYNKLTTPLEGLTRAGLEDILSWARDFREEDHPDFITGAEAMARGWI